MLRHAPAAELTTPFGLAGAERSRFDGVRLVPQATLGDVEDTGLGAAADLALLLSLGAASRLRAVESGPPRPTPRRRRADRAVDRVFRDWNLDDRRVNEWRMLVAGGAAVEDAAPAADAVRGRARRARARLGAALAHVAAHGERPDAGRVGGAVARRTPRPCARPTARRFRPTNAQLTAGIRYLLDLPA